MKKQKKKRDLEKRISQQTVYNRTKQSRTVHDAWLAEYQWVNIIENGTLSCSAYPELSDHNSSLTKAIIGKFSKETLKYHDKSDKHVK